MNRLISAQLAALLLWADRHVGILLSASDNLTATAPRADSSQAGTPAGTAGRWSGVDGWAYSHCVSARAEAGVEQNLTEIEAQADADQRNSALVTRTGALKYKLQSPLLRRLLVFENEVWRGEPDVPDSIGGFLAGARAEVVTQGQNTSRLTAARVLMLGVFALAAQKKTGFLHFIRKIVAPGFEITCLPVAEASTKQLEVFTNIADYIANMRSPTPAGRGSCVLAG